MKTRTIRSCGALLFGAIFALHSAPSLCDEAPVPVRDEFVVNSYTTSGQGARDVRALADGGFVVVWTSYGSYGSDSYASSVQGQLFGADGSHSGGQFQINTYTTSNEQAGTVAATGEGDFLVTWRGATPGADLANIKGQWYDDEWSPLGGEFQINTISEGPQHHPAVSSDGSDGLVVVWHGPGIRGQRYAADRSPEGGPFQVNTLVNNPPSSAPAVSLDGAGGFVVVWEQWFLDPPDDERGSIQARRFASDGTALGPLFRVNTYTTLGQRHPVVSEDGAGGFVVVWTSNGSFGSDTSLDSIQARRYAANGLPLGSEFQVNSYTPGQQKYPDVSLDGAGGFVVVWQSDSSETGPDKTVLGRKFGANGLPVGEEFQLGSTTSGTNWLPFVGRHRDREFVVVWTGNEVRARRFAVPLFADDFESGDTSGWSTTVP